MEQQLNPLESASGRPLSPLLQREARERANQWLARFTPVLEDPSGLTAAECRDRLQLIAALKPEGETAVRDLAAQGGDQDAELLSTLRAAGAELQAQEDELRQRLAVVAPGDPAGQVDLSRLRARLAEAAARREVEEAAPTLNAYGTGDLELVTVPASPGAAVASGLFATAWLSFTTFHAVFMIGGLFRSFGWWALCLLLFYSLFFGAGAAMVWGTWRSTCRETVTLSGQQLTLRRMNRVWKSEKTHLLLPGARVYLTPMTVRSSESSGMELAAQVEGGTEVRFGSGRPKDVLASLAEEINHYLAGA